MTRAARGDDDEPEGDGTDNRSLAERLSLAAANAEGHLARAYRRAARAALLWPVEARDLVAHGGALTDLPAIGPYLARVLARWVAEPGPPRVPPPLRRGFLTLAHARRVLARRPLAVKGDLQVHTTWSDGRAEPGEMAEAARTLGRRYLAITDHSQGLKIAGGVDPDELAAQGRVLDALNARATDGFVLLRAVEANLDPAGGLDLPAEALRGLDLVLAAFHSALRRTEDQTERYLAALRNPLVDVLAHPRCRVYDRRLGLTADWPRVFAEAAEQGKAVEVDGFCDRQDLDLVRLEQARAAGCTISLGSDAHRPDELAALDLAAAAVRIVGVPPRRVLNTWGPAQIRGWVRERRG